MDRPPSFAEKMLVSDFERYVEGESVLVSGLKTKQDPIFSCPRCRMEQDSPSHGKLGACDRCLLTWVSYGNALYIWDATPKPPPKPQESTLVKAAKKVVSRLPRVRITRSVDMKSIEEAGKET